MTRPAACGSAVWAALPEPETAEDERTLPDVEGPIAAIRHMREAGGVGCAGDIVTKGIGWVAPAS